MKNFVISIGMVETILFEMKKRQLWKKGLDQTIHTHQNKKEPIVHMSNFIKTFVSSCSASRAPVTKEAFIILAVDCFDIIILHTLQLFIR